MAKSSFDNPTGCLLLSLTGFFGLLGLFITYNEIYGLVGGDEEASFGLLALGLFFLIVAAVSLKEARRSREPLTLLSSHVNPMDRVAQAKSNEEKELALLQASDMCKAASNISPMDRNLLDQIKENIIAAPTQAEVADALNQKVNRDVNFANPDLQPLAFAVKPASLLIYSKGVLLEVITWGYILFGIAYTFSALAGGGYLPTAQREKGFLYKALRMRRRAKQYRLRPQKVLQRDNRPPVLYLRSFSDDYEEDPENYIPTTYEEKLVRHYKSQGPVLAVGRPTEDLPLLGASRIYFDDSTWKAGVLYLMSVSQLVIVEAGCARGTLWELGMVRQRSEPQRLVISFAGWSALEAWDRHLNYLRFKKYAEELLGCELPSNIKGTSYLSFDADWKIKTQAPNEILSLADFQPPRWSLKIRWASVVSVVLLVVSIIITSRLSDTPLPNAHPLMPNAASTGPVSGTEQGASGSGDHLAEARKALADGYTPSRNLLKATWGRVGDAREHLQIIGPTDNDYSEAQTLLEEVKRREKEMARASAAIVRNMQAERIRQDLAKGGVSVSFTLSGAEYSILTLRGNNVVFSNETARLLAGQTNILTLLRDVGFTKVVFRNKDGEKWIHDLAK